MADSDKVSELSEEEVFSNDIDPLDAIRELRKAEGASSEELNKITSEESSVEIPKEEIKSEEDAAEMAELQDEDSEKEPETASDTSKETSPQTKDLSADVVITEKSDSKENEDGTTPTHSSAKEEDKKEEEKSEVTTTHKFRANGQDFEFTQEEMLGQFETVFGQAMDYTQKMQKIAPYRKMISALESEGITQDQLNIAIDALKGDKGAIQKIIETNNIDKYDLDSDEDTTPYTPKEYGKNEFQLEIEEVTSKIEKDEEYKITVDVIDNQWDQDSRATIAKNPNMIMGLHNDIKSGLYDKVAPAAMKIKVLDGNTKSDIEYYMIAGENLRQQQLKESGKTVDELNKPAQNADSNFEKASSEAKTKRSATSTRARSDSKSVIDYLDDDNDEAYDAWYKKLQASN